MLNLGISHLHGYNAIAESGFIKSIQAFSITIASGATTGTATINSVSTTLTSLHFSGQYADLAGARDGRYHFSYLTQTNATTITATRNGTNDNLVIKGYAIEWDAAFVKSVQMGTATITTTGTTATAAISAVDLANSCIQWNGVSGSIAGGSQSILTTVHLSSTTQVTATRTTGTSATVVTGFCVIEFQSGVLNSNTQAANPSKASGTSGDATISSVTAAQTWLVYGGSFATQGWNNAYDVKTYLFDATTVRHVTNLTVASQARVTAVEFKAAQVSAIQNVGSTELKDATNPYVDITVTSVDTTKSIVNYLGSEGTTGSGTTAALTQFSLAFQSATSVRALRSGVSNTIGMTPSIQVIPFTF